MESSLHNYMKVGVIHFMAFPETIGGEGPILETLEKIAADEYFEAIAVSWIKAEKVREQAAAMLLESGLEVAYGAHPRLLSQKLSLNNLEEQGRKAALATCKEGIDEAIALGATSFVYLSGPWTEEKKEDHYKALVDSTLELSEYAESKGGLRLVHENFDHGIDKRSLIGPTPVAVRYAEEIRKRFPDFGLLVDLSHIPLIGEKPREALGPVRDYLASIDIGNCLLKDPSHPRYGDTHPRFCYPGGENQIEELTEFLQVLLEIGFLQTETRPVVSFEVRPFGEERSSVYLAQSKRTLNAAWMKVRNPA
jgi:sugar phosphate isomerase/epimerase